MATGVTVSPIGTEGGRVNPKEYAQQVFEEIKDYVASGTELGVFVAGKAGVGKSSLINSLIGGVAKEGATVEPVTPDVIRYITSIDTPIPGRENEQTIFTVWDSPGFGDLFIDDQCRAKRLQEITHAIEKAHVLVYCFKISERMGRDDGEGLIEITKKLGPSIWSKAVFVLTFANKLELPPGAHRTDLAQYCTLKIQEWRDAITKVLRHRTQVPEDILADISVVPVGYRDANPPDRNDWYTTFWMKLFQRTCERGKAGLLRLTWKRFNCDKSLNVNEKQSNKDVLPVQLFNNDRLTNLIDLGDLREYLPAPAPVSPVKNEQVNQTHVIIVDVPPGKDVGHPPPDSFIREELPRQVPVEEHPEVLKGDSKWRKAIKIGTCIGGGAVAGALVGMLIGLVGGPPGMAAGAAAGFMIGGGTGVGSVIANAIFKQMKNKKMKQQPAELGVEQQHIIN